MSMIQVELVREAILAVCSCLIKKQRKEGRPRGRLQSREWPATFSASISTEKKISMRAIYCTSPVSKKSLVAPPTLVSIAKCFCSSELDLLNTKNQNSVKTPTCNTGQNRPEELSFNTTPTNSDTGNQIVPEWDQSLVLCPPNPFKPRGLRHMQRAMQPGPGQKGCRRDRGAGGYTGVRPQDYK